MSYSIYSPCHNCDKKETCTDLKRVTEAVLIIHNTRQEEGHQGSGYITLTCCNHNTKN